MTTNLKAAIVGALALASGMLPRRPAKPKARKVTQDDVERLAAANAKRLRKAAKRGAK